MGVCWFNHRVVGEMVGWVAAWFGGQVCVRVTALQCQGVGRLCTASQALETKLRTGRRGATQDYDEPSACSALCLAFDRHCAAHLHCPR